jgi:hypothetical protein
LIRCGFGYLFLIRYSRNEGVADDVRPVPIITGDGVYFLKCHRFATWPAGHERARIFC